MFLGQQILKLHQDNRLTLPVDIRLQLSGKAVLTQGFDQNLVIFPEVVFQGLHERISAVTITSPTARNLSRLLYANASQLDNSDEVVIPASLMNYAGLDRELILVGQGEYLEIWSRDRWDRQAADLADPERNAQRFAEINLS